MTQVPDDTVFVGSNFGQVSVDALLVTPTGGTQGRLADKLASTGGGSVGTIAGSFSSDGSFSSPIPGGALIIAGKITPNSTTGATISLGTTSGGSDVFPATLIPGSASGPTPLQGANFLLTTFTADQTIFAHSPSWASMAINIWYIGP